MCFYIEVVVYKSSFQVIGAPMKATNLSKNRLLFANVDHPFSGMFTDSPCKTASHDGLVDPLAN